MPGPAAAGVLQDAGAKRVSGSKMVEKNRAAIQAAKHFADLCLANPVAFHAAHAQWFDLPKEVRSSRAQVLGAAEVMHPVPCTVVTGASSAPIHTCRLLGCNATDAHVNHCALFWI